MLDVFNYEGKQINLYPQIWIDWLTPHEIQFIRDNNNELEQNLNSMFSDEDVEVSNENEMTNSKEELDMQVEDFFGEEIENSFGEEIEDPFGEEIEDPFGEGVEEFLIENNEIREEEEEFLSEIENLIKESEGVVESSKDTEKKDVFLLQSIPVFVGEEKIADLALDINTLKLLNMFIKRKWVLKMSESESIVMDDEFLIKNALKLC